MHKDTKNSPQKANAVLSPVLVKQANIFADLPAKLIEEELFKRGGEYQK